MTTILGIDPGATGAIGMICPLVETWAMPDTPHDLVALLRTFDPATTRVYVEQVHSMPGQGVASTFKFGRGWGNPRRVGRARHPAHANPPQTWKRAMGLVGKPKSESKRLAQQLFGADVARSEGKAEALLIAEWGRRQRAKMEAAG